MTGPFPRPTRQHVDADLAEVDHRGGADPASTRRLAAEVRALRVEQRAAQPVVAAARAYVKAWRDGDGQTDATDALFLVVDAADNDVPQPTVASAEANRNGPGRAAFRGGSCPNINCFCARPGLPCGEYEGDVSTRGWCPCCGWNEAAHSWSGPQPAVPDDENVPARLDAAADALEQHHHHGLAYELREVATQLCDGEGGTPALRAAVAAALARPTGAGS